MKKRLLSLILATSMVSTLLAGCGSQKEQEVAESTPTSKSETTKEATQSSASEPTDEVVTLTFSAQNDTGTDWNETLVFKEYEKRLGIKLDTTTYTTDQWSSKFTLMLTEDDLPDLVRPNVSYTAFQEYASEGYFLDFSQYLDDMPNLQAIFEKYPDYKKVVTSEDGGIYGFPQLQTYPANTKYGYYIIAQRWLDNLGLERPETLDDLYEVLKAFKEQDANGNGDPNDEIPMIMGNNAWDNERMILWAFDIPARVYYYQLRADENDQVGIWDTTDNYKEFLRYMNMLYEEELINQDAFSMEIATLTDLAMNDKAGFVGQRASGVPATRDKDYYYMPVGMTQEGYTDAPNVTISRTVGYGNILLAASAETENPEAVVKFVDYMWSEEGSISTGNGYEGITFDYNEIHGQKVIDHTNYWKDKGYDTEGDYRNVALALNATRIYITAAGSIYSMMENLETDKLMSDEVWALTSINSLRDLAFRDPELVVNLEFPSYPYTDAEAAERSTLYTDISSYLATAKADFITGAKDIDADWDAHLKKLNDMGLEKLLEIEQAAYDRYLGK